MLLAQVTPSDVVGAALRLHLGPTRWPAVASRTFVVGAMEVVLDVLAASHRVTVRHLRQPEAHLVETVACGTSTAQPVELDSLPSSHADRVGGFDYRFESTTLSGADAVRSAAGRVREITTGVSVAFPGHHDALTGLRLQVGPGDGTGVGWHTWHVYPGRRPHVVTTSSTVQMGGPVR